MNDNLTEWIALSLVPGLGARGASQLVRACGSPSAAFSASPAELAVHGLCRDAILGIRLAHLRPEAEEIRKKCEQAQIRTVTLDCPGYPSVLKEIHDPPIVLYLQGCEKTLNKPAIAIVGTRRPTPYGLHAAKRLAQELAFRGLSICSGLARGIDTAAHLGALCSSGCTVAVLGSGVDVIYPKENQKNAAAIIESGGALISEYPPETFPAPQNFPVRNRIISGLSLGVVVVEASEYSGSLITARMALDQNREIFAVPGNISSETSLGPNRLIQQGAKLVQTWQDVVEELPFELRRTLLQSPLKPEPQGLPIISEEEAALVNRLRPDVATHIDELYQWADKSPGWIHDALLNLEMKGYICQLPGKRFIRRT